MCKGTSYDRTMRVVLCNYGAEKGEQLVPNLSFGNLRFYHSVLGEELTLIYITAETPSIKNQHKHFWGHFLDLMKSPCCLRCNYYLLREHSHMTSDVFWVFLTYLLTYLNQMIYYINLFSKIRCSLTCLST